MAVDAVSLSIREFGFRQPIVIDEHHVIVVGHTRYLAAKKLGLTNVPVHIATGLSAAQVKAYRLADNRTNENASWDQERLVLEIADLDGCLDLALTGFTSDELQALRSLNTERLSEQGDADAAPEIAEVEPKAKVGDLYRLGEHRLMCGDATDLAQVSALMHGERADLIFTDPPYGMSYGGGRAAGAHVRDHQGGVKIKAHGAILGDELRGAALEEFLYQALSNAVAVKREDAAVYVCLSWRSYLEFTTALQRCGLTAKACIVWDKQSIGLGFGAYRPQHEWVLYCPGAWYGDAAQADVFRCSRGATRAYVHPTQKPLELIEMALHNSSKPGQRVLDLFGGSGSTLMACARTQRIAYVMERDPRYIDVIIQRWEQMSGQHAEQIARAPASA